MDLLDFRLLSVLNRVLFLLLEDEESPYYVLSLVCRRFRSFCLIYCRKAIARRNCRHPRWPTNLQDLRLADDFFFSPWIERSRWWNTTTLPRSLLRLHLGENFNRPCSFSGCSALQYLHLGARFNRPLPTSQLPSSLRYLHLGVDFDQPFSIAGLPRSLHTLIFSERYSTEIGSLYLLPASLRFLLLPPSYQPPIHRPRSWPRELQVIIWNRGNYQVPLHALWARREEQDHSPLGKV